MKTIIANWKMNLSVRESVALTRGVLRGTRGKENLPEVILCASYTALSDLRKVLTRSRVQLGAQDMFWEDSGAFTGEISARQLKELGCTRVILGHSERRRELAETDQMVNKKIRAALAAKIVPIICVGESAEVRKEGPKAAEEYVQQQLDKIFEGIKVDCQ